MNSFAIVVFGLCLSSLCVKGAVNDKWYSSGDYGYFFSNTQLNQKNAKLACEERKAKLVKVDSDQIQAFLIETIRSISGNTPREYYIGLERNAHNIITWIDGSSVVYSAWAEGEPNNAWWSENCGQLLARTQQWNDVNCGATTNFICQRRNARPSPIVETWYKNGDQQYYISTSQLTFNNAIYACVERRSTLVMVKTDRIQAFLRKQLHTIHREHHTYYIGMHRIENSEGHKDELEWIDGTALSYTAWRWGEPNNSWGVENCGELVAETQLWNDIACWTVMHFICAKDI